MKEVKNNINNNLTKNNSEFFNLVEELLAILPERSREILKKRYGLVEDGESQTLEHIGQDYGITRERVRQIVSDTMKVVCSQFEVDNFKKAEEKIIFTIEKNNGIVKEIEIVVALNQDAMKEANAIKFLAECSKRIHFVFEKGIIEKSWILSKSILEQVKRVNFEAETILKERRTPLKDEDLSNRIVEKISEMNKEQVLSFLKVLSRIKKNRFGKWGIHNWMEINPKGSREKIYLVLKEERKSLHFTDIAKLIDKHGLGKKKSHPQTIHNELIKDERFVLIGRGIYALKEWGYYEGTIKDVLQNILREKKQPLKKEEIMDEVFKVRKVKKTTVMINLNNSQVFKREDDFYSLK